MKLYRTCLFSFLLLIWISGHMDPSQDALLLLLPASMFEIIPDFLTFRDFYSLLATCATLHTRCAITCVISDQLNLAM